MKKDMPMKKLLVIGVVVALGIAGFMVIKNRVGMSSSMKSNDQGQIVITNDSDDTISVEYKLGGKDVGVKIPAREKITCGSDGFVRVFVASKAGSYELTFPADDSEARSVTLSQIIAAGQKKEAGDVVYTEKGMIGDVKVLYEEVLESD